MLTVNAGWLQPGSMTALMGMSGAGKVRKWLMFRLKIQLGHYD